MSNGMEGNVVTFPVANKSSFTLPETSSESEVEQMDVDKFIDRLDQDRRESEARAKHDLEALKRELREDRQLMEQRTREERRESEARIEQSFKEAMSEMKEARKEIREINRWVASVCIATLLGIAALVVTMIVSGVA